jgi:phosphoadenosine phosphosulfate reductase
MHHAPNESHPMSVFPEVEPLTAPTSLVAFLDAAQARFGDTLAVASSLGAEDVILIEAVARRTRSGAAPIRIFTLDTGRLPQETYELHEALEARYGLRIESVFPDTVSVQALVRRQGPNGFYHSLEARHACCAVRKLEPLERALSGVDAWITGLRRAQSVTRTEVPLAESDGTRVKLNPLAHWTDDEVWTHIRSHKIPYSSLHDTGYPSVGCAPCTRAVEPGAHPRSGRWWWEDPEHKECGLHVARLRHLEATRRSELENA